MNGFGRVITVVAIVVAFGLVALKFGAPDRFNALVTETGLAPAAPTSTSASTTSSAPVPAQTSAAQPAAAQPAGAQPAPNAAASH